MSSANASEIFDANQHYPSYPMPDGSLPVIEGTVFLHDQAHPEWKQISVGFPVSLIRPGKHELVLHCDGVRLHILVDGYLMDENFIYGTIDFSRKAELQGCFSRISLSVPGITPRITVEHEQVDQSLQFFSPPGFNAWVGDVVPYESNGTVHMFYLHDRRHHGSKFGTGAHYYGHYSSKDLKNWEEHEFVGLIENQWESCGTGTPFQHNGKYYFAYGLHTDRFTPYQDNGGILLRQEAEKSDVVHGLTFEELGERHPEGMTYAESDDCIHFTKSRKLPHFSENPSVYTMPDNSLNMYADGLWNAEKIEGPWHRLSCDFPPNGKNSAMRNTLECPSFFEWNGHYYLFVGMSGLYGASNPDFSDYEDLAAQGRDVYDGMIVPMVFPFQKDRRLISGWIFPFGTYFCIHELLQFDDFDLGIKWVPELYPDVTKREDLAMIPVPGESLRFLDSPERQNSCYNIELSGEGSLSLQFLDGNGEGCEFQLNTIEKWAQYETVSGDHQVFAEPLKTMCQVLDEWRDQVEIFKEIPSSVKYKCHVFSTDYRLDKLRNVGTPFVLRIMVKDDPKMPGTILDAEIAGVRTMLSLRIGLRVDKVMLAVKDKLIVSKITVERLKS